MRIYQPAPALVTDLLAQNPPAARVTQGLYARTQPTPDSGGTIRPLALDPSNAARIWAAGTTSGKVGFSDDNGATFTASGPANPDTNAAGGTALGMYFSNNFCWLLMGGSATERQGALFRSPLPAADGTGVVWTRVMDLTSLVNGPGGGASSSLHNTTFRNAGFAVQADESAAYLLEYGAGNVSVAFASTTDVIMAAGSDVAYSPGGYGEAVGHNVGRSVSVSGAGAAGAALATTVVEILSSKKFRLADSAQTAVTAATLSASSAAIGAGVVQSGPKLYVSTNLGGASGSVTWSLGKQFTFAKHGHAVKVIGGVPWVSLGDANWPASQVSGSWYQGISNVGVWAATSAAASSWNQKTVFTPLSPYVAINLLPLTLNGQAVVAAESDSSLGIGPLVIPTQSGSAGVVSPFPLHRLPAAYVGTMRCLGLTAEGNLLWLQTGETAAVGPLDSLWLSEPPFSTAVLLESLASSLNTFGTVGDAVIRGGYAWFGTYRVKVEKFVGQ